MVAKELYNAYTQVDSDDAQKLFLGAYNKSNWVLTRFDNGSYWIDEQWGVHHNYMQVIYVKNVSNLCITMTLGSQWRVVFAN